MGERVVVEPWDRHNAAHLVGGDCLNVGCAPSKALLGLGRWTG